jgi:hypothetical protein
LKPNTGATNESGFTALPGGTAGESGSGLIGETGFWWTTFKENDFIYFAAMGKDVPYATIIGTALSPADDIKSGYSVRCVKNTGTTQVSEIEISEQINIYPDPANEKLYIKNIDPADASIMIFDLQGRLVLNKQIDSESMDISDLRQGIYLAKVVCPGKIMFTKFIKQ